MHLIVIIWFIFIWGTTKDQSPITLFTFLFCYSVPFCFAASGLLAFTKHSSFDFDQRTAGIGMFLLHCMLHVAMGSVPKVTK